MRRIYLDHNATTPVRPEVLEALLPFYAGSFGNPSSIHHEGRVAREAVEAAREQVATFCGCQPAEVVFTSCGSEADNLAIKGVAAAAESAGRHIITTAVEHPAVLNACLYLESRGWRITRLPVDGQGLLDPQEVRRALAPDTVLISVMLANNETGVLFPVAEVGEIAADARIPFHCDAVQGAGRVPVTIRGTGAGLLALSGHKLYGPKGVGALVVRTGTKLHPLVHGGAQERNRRGGTENVAAIVGFGSACQLAAGELAAEAPRLAGLRDLLEGEILRRIPDCVVNGGGALRLPNTSNISFAGVRADSLLPALDLKGFSVSSGSACSSGTLRRSPVLAAMGVDEGRAACSVRFSLGRDNRREDVETLLEVLPEVVERLRGGRGEGR
ncbi:MAG TPA: cysteine desulfurase family protein [Verrucomicrobiae bacterium]|nr:cysteine desulfurase family protein [Verrucomicrobiae bacterium]